MSYVRLERHGHIALVTIDRPEARNALSPVHAAELWEAWEAFRQDPDLWVEITTGAGDTSFCAGADLKYAGDPPAPPNQQPYWAVLTDQWRCWKPQIAAVNGYALGGGTELALVHDVVVAAERATFALPEVKWSAVSGVGAVLLSRQVPLKLAMELILTGRSIPAAEAYRLGLVNRVVPNGLEVETAFAIAEEICRNGPLAVRASKELVLRGLDTPIHTALGLGYGIAWPASNSEDRNEGRRAFAERRQPRYTGR